MNPPEADERGFLAGLVMDMVLIIPMLGKGQLKYLGTNPLPTTLAVGWIAYMVLFGRRLRNRGELKTVLIASAAFFALLLGLGIAAALV
jgi:hypothetical protein